ncbi:MAG: ABC transporter permease subunit [Planctomycetaceae bacterium]|nr:ABC transporter permease subunit [Planctomycetaceae bacterium]
MNATTSTSTTAPSGRLASACSELFWLTLRRQLRSRQTLVCLALTTLCALIVLAWAQQRSPTAKKLAEQVLIPTFVGFLMPIFAVSYGASGIGGEREDRTLIYLLIAPIPRAVLYLVKAFATMLLVALWAGGSLGVMCLLAGEHGREVFFVFLPASLLGTTVYAALFLFLGASFRHGTIISLAYWFFLEVLFGAMPGIVKRVTVSFYVKCLIYEAGEDLRLRPMGRVSQETFLAVTGDTALIALASALVGLLVLGAGVLSAREYAELG